MYISANCNLFLTLYQIVSSLMPDADSFSIQLRLCDHLC